MLHVSVLLWLGVSLLYFGFAGVLGVIVKRAASNSTASMTLLAWLHGTCLFIPASIFVVWMPESTPWIQIPVFLAGVTISYLAYKQPAIIPYRFWGRTFALRYFGVAMVFATLWGVSLFLADEVLLIVPLTLATTFAGTVSFISAPRIS